MRFNDLIPTILSAPVDGHWSSAILWRQCIDLIAQFDQHEGFEAAELDPVVATLQGISQKVDIRQKLGALQELGHRLTSPRLVHLLVADEAPVQVAAMHRARLEDAEWPPIIAKAGPLARSVLRQRTDLGADARRALDAFGLTDLSLVDYSVAAASRAEAVNASLPLESITASLEDQSQIRRIVDRIERFTSERQERNHRDSATDPLDADVGEAIPKEKEEAISHVSFLTDADGVIRTVQGTPAAAFAGFRLATPSLDRSTGPDGQILGAFRRRGAFREARLTIGEGLYAGCWLVDGDPLFDQQTGRFTGYRGNARRAGRYDIAPFMAARDDAPDHGSTQAEEGTRTSTSTSLRQLIHELRTPLSGVMGFAELIENQFLGPVNDSYRTMAGSIVADVRNLVDILDDIDLANRTDRLSAAPGAQGANAAHIFADAVERFGPDMDGRQRIQLDALEEMSFVEVAPTIVERMILHFVRAITGCVGAETLAARCRQEGDRMLVEIDRPAAMAGLSDTQLFDSGFEHVAVNMDAPVLGVGFALRLVRRLAQANKGAFTVQPGYFALAMPVPSTPMEQGVSS